MCVYVKQLDGMNNKVKRNYHQPRFGRLYLASENAEPLSVLLTCFLHLSLFPTSYHINMSNDVKLVLPNLFKL